MRKTGGMNAREKLFCGYMAMLGEPFEAARRAGYSRAACKKAVLALMARADIQWAIRDCQQTMGELMPDDALRGLARIALGGGADAARLVLTDGELSEEEVWEMDLLAISELRRRRDGSLEVKMADRVQALRLLLEYTKKSGGDGIERLLRALDRSAQADEQAV